MPWVCWATDCLIKLYLNNPFLILAEGQKGRDWLSHQVAKRQAAECDMEVAARGFWELMATWLPSLLTILIRTAGPKARHPRRCVQRKG